MRHIAGFLIASCSFLFGLAQGADDEETRFIRSVVVQKDRTSPGDVICILCSVTVQGTVTGDVIAVGGDIEVSGSVTGDVIAAGGRVTVLSGAQTDGDLIAVGGSLETTSRAKPPADFLTVPYFHLPGQRSFHPIGVLTLICFMLLVTMAAAAIVRSGQSARISDEFVRRPWLILLLGLAGWILFGFAEEQLDAEGIFRTIAVWLLLGLVLAMMLFGYAGILWLLGRRVVGQQGWKAWAVAGLIVIVGLLVPVAGALLGCLLLIVTLGSGIERTTELGVAVVARFRGHKT